MIFTLNTVELAVRFRPRYKFYSMSIKIKIDPVNFNKHSEIGMELLETSIREVGVIEIFVLTKKEKSLQATHDLRPLRSWVISLK